MAPTVHFFVFLVCICCQLFPVMYLGTLVKVSCVHSYKFFCPILILDVPFTCGREYMYLDMFGATCKVGQLLFNTYLVLLVHTWTMSVRKKFGIVSIDSCCPFHSLILR